VPPDQSDPLDPAVRLGLPPGTTACLFDLDGVLTSTAVVHKAAWKTAFDAFLQLRDGDGFRPFTDTDYTSYVDGKPRADGVRDFLASRDITLPEGSPDDPPDAPDAPDAPTINGLGNKKNVDLLQRIKNDGVQPYEGSVRYLHAARDAGLRRAVVSSSANCRDVVQAAGLSGLLEARVDGATAAEQGLKGKPAPDTFLAGARELGVEPRHAAVFEDATAGAQAGKAGGFGAVIGVDRVQDGTHADDLTRHGATVVVRDLAELLDERSRGTAATGPAA